MGAPIDFPSFSSGEISPSMLGRTDVARFKSSATTMRNMFVRHTGGAFSRAGTAFVGYSKQTGRNYPPRLLPFQFNNDQGLALEFGNFYMRVIFDGALVTEPSLAISAATNANPCVLTIPATGGSAATPIDGGVTSSYAPNDIVTLAGGTFSIQAQVSVTTTKLVSIQPQAGAGRGYVPADTVTLAGGVQAVAPVVTVSKTQVTTAIVNAPGSGGPHSAVVTMTGTTGSGTPFQASVNTDSTGAILSVNFISVPGSYTVNPTSLSAEPVTGGGITGATLTITMGPGLVSVTTPGSFTVNPGGGSMTQSATSGSGTGASFISALLGPNACTVSNPGSYTVFPSNPVAQAASSGSGLGVEFTITSGSTGAYNEGDWLFLSGATGMTQLNGRTVVVGVPSGTDFPIYDVFGNPIDSTTFGAYTGSGEAARIFTLATPWAEADLEYLKQAESTDTVSLCCVNQVTNVEYPPYDLLRNTDSNWTLTAVQMSTSIAPPGYCNLSITVTPTGATAFSHYQYVATAVAASDGKESQASPIGDLPSGVDIAAYAGTITINVGTSQGAAYYNYYKATPGYSYSSVGIPAPPVGSQFGFVGYSFGPQFIDQNIVPDFTQLPPIHSDPFARGTIEGANVVAVGNGYTHATATITTSTGETAVIQCVVVNAQVVGYVATNPGRNYAATDTVAITGDGSGATANLVVGPQSGTYPAVVGYYQERRAYASTLNNPNTYYMSSTGAYTNFDERIPPIDTDAIIGTPWAQQVNGIQFMVSMPGGFVVLTGLAAWQVTGAGGSSFNPQPIAPSTQLAQPQAYNGCSSTVPPIRINTDIIYVQAKGSLYRDLTYQFFTNIYTGTDLTIYSSHLFLNYTIREHTWAEEPFKIIWSVRSDGIMLSLTYLREQDIWGWARHDTQGAYYSVCSVTEPPVDAVYLATARTIGNQNAYFLERMDNRLWTDVESTWCVDCGLALPLSGPNASITIASVDGIGALIGVTNLVGGQSYSPATTATVVDANGLGPGEGATVQLTIVNGVIEDVVFPSNGSSYTYPALVLNDPSGLGQGASATILINSVVTITASSSAFQLQDVGSYLRAGGCLAEITGFANSQQVGANVLRPIVQIPPYNDGAPITFISGSWSIGAATTEVTGLYHLAGAEVVGIADGIAFGPIMVSAQGSFALPNGAASVVKVGLAFQPQLQTSNLDLGQPSTQGQRKKSAQVTVRANASLGIKVGGSQQDGSKLNPMQIAPPWFDLDVLADLLPPPFQEPGYLPLWSGDVRTAIGTDWTKTGQISLQQDNPYPMEILSVIPEYLPGDDADTAPKPRQRGNGR